LTIVLALFYLENILINNLPSAPNGIKIKEIEIVIRVASNNQKQKDY